MTRPNKVAHTIRKALRGNPDPLAALAAWCAIWGLGCETFDADLCAFDREFCKQLDVVPIEERTDEARGKAVLRAVDVLKDRHKEEAKAFCARHSVA